MQVTLTDEQGAALDRLSQLYGRDKGDVLVAMAAHMLEQERQLEELREAIQVGLDDLARGDEIELSDETFDQFFEDICREGREELARRKRSA